MLNCREITEHTSEYLDGRLPWAGRLTVRMHLLLCWSCRQYVRQMQTVIAALKQLPSGPGPDEAMLQRLREALAEQRKGAS